MEFGLSKSIEVTCNEHYQEADKNIRTNIELLKDVVKNLSNNNILLESLENNKNATELNDEERERILNELSSFQTYIENFTFINAINIASNPGKYILRSSLFKGNYDIMSRPWMKQEYLYNRQTSVVTDIHDDIYTGEKRFR